MPWVLGPIRPTNQYTDEQTLKCPLSIGVSLRVEWAPIWVQVQPETMGRGESWEPEELFPRGYHTLARAISAIRFRAALANVPVLVVVTAIKNYE